MKTGVLRGIGILVGAALALSPAGVPQASAQPAAGAQGPKSLKDILPQQGEAVPIPPEEFAKALTQFKLTDLSPEQLFMLIRVMSAAQRGGASEPIPLGPGGASDPMAALSAVSQAAMTPPGSTAAVPPVQTVPAPTPAPGGVTAYQSLAIFPQIPPAVAGTKQDLGRWLVFQAELLLRIGQAYTQYGEELLGKSGFAQSSKPAPDAAKPVPAPPKPAAEKKKP